MKIVDLFDFLLKKHKVLYIYITYPLNSDIFYQNRVYAVYKSQKSI